MAAVVSAAEHRVATAFCESERIILLLQRKAYNLQRAQRQEQLVVGHASEEQSAYWRQASLLRQPHCNSVEMNNTLKR